jgi:putative nucleotidyltransferase with HDIG domain
MLPRDQAFALLRQHLSDEALVFHSIESEAVMRALARRLGQDEERWGLAGLLHDVDFALTAGTPERHGLSAAALLAAEDVPAAVIEAIEAHNGERNGTAITAPFHHALRCAETVTGLISAAALVQPDRKLASVQPSSVRRKLKDKAFARKVSRDTIRECEKLGLEVGEFIALAVEAMQRVASEVGL